jgi:hypothetical protein
MLKYAALLTLCYGCLITHAAAAPPRLSGHAQLDTSVTEDKLDLVLSTAAINLSDDLRKHTTYRAGATYNDHDILLHHAVIDYTGLSALHLGGGWGPVPPDEDNAFKITTRANIMSRVSQTDGRYFYLRHTWSHLDLLVYGLDSTETDSPLAGGTSVTWKHSPHWQSRVRYLSTATALPAYQATDIDSGTLGLTQILTLDNATCAATLWSPLTSDLGRTLQLTCHQTLGARNKIELSWEHTPHPLTDLPQGLLQARIQRTIFTGLAWQGEWRQERDRVNTNALYLGLRATF